jgi:glycosyltransferase A (GT-A) superfamily protein (DUF2064 family)
MNDSVCLLFIKSPEKGKVKSRLAEIIGEDLALGIYKCLVMDALQIVKQFTFQICFYPPDSIVEVRNWLGEGFSYTPQKGEDLGERMSNAFQDSFSAGFEQIGRAHV